jgi:Cu(I)/Ag(I) efflux system membrane protein CusA/SilA
MVLGSAFGGATISETIQGRKRYSINMRYPRELRDSVEKLNAMYIPSTAGGTVQMMHVADIRIET